MGYVQDSKNKMWITKPLLKMRGWTDASIRDFLPEPEAYKQNQNYGGSRSPMGCWSPETVAAAEHTREWQVWLESSLVRRNTTVVALSSGLDIPDWLEAKLERAESLISSEQGKIIDAGNEVVNV